jgi:hypothetical protein
MRVTTTARSKPDRLKVRKIFEKVTVESQRKVAEIFEARKRAQVFVEDQIRRRMLRGV